MRISLLAGVIVAVAAGAFVAGRITADSRPKESSAPHVYTLRRDDVVSVPGPRLRCTASAEAGFPNFLCWHVPHGRYEISFYADSFLVWAGPDNVVFSAKWRR